MARLRGPNKKNGPLETSSANEYLHVRILQKGVNCGEIQKGKRRDSDRENENEDEDRIAEEIKV